MKRPLSSSSWSGRCFFVRVAGIAINGYTIYLVVIKITSTKNNNLIFAAENYPMSSAICSRAFETIGSPCAKRTVRKLKS